MTIGLSAALLAKRPVNCHKGTVGRVLAVAGSYGYTGAAYLASLSALRVGAGLVTLAANKSIAPIMAVKCTEVMPKPVEESAECTGALGMKSYDEIMALADNNDTVLIGPGLGRHPDTCALVQSLVVALGSEERIQLVIDADGLYALWGMSGLLKKCVNPAILTPHLGELAGLIGCRVEELQGEDGSIDRLMKATREKAQEWNAVIVAKSHRTIVAVPDGRVFVTTTGNPGMATAGCGDVLAGAIAGIAGEVAGTESRSIAAALVGTQLHGLAGDMAGARLGNGMIASDIISCLPKARLLLER
ncbi:MAG: NAD(P)H-hydrate dehydratase [Selenomonadaceae bacterium]|nr:NAD(P)H-hydrate dehydratase [Selenomonadaceae bacterium]